jgi:hypothetical protein
MEMKEMWNVIYINIPVIIWATEILTKGFKKYLDAVPGKHSIDLLQKQLYLEHHT